MLMGCHWHLDLPGGIQRGTLGCGFASPSRTGGEKPPSVELSSLLAACRVFIFVTKSQACVSLLSCYFYSCLLRILNYFYYFIFHLCLEALSCSSLYKHRVFPTEFTI